jgi:hypothetical protein
MTKSRWIGLLWLFLSSWIFIQWGSMIERTAPGGMADFKAVYYGARCLLQHTDPYNQNEFLRVYQTEDGKFPSDPVINRLFRRAIFECINLPTSLFLIAPFAMLAWGPAHILWMILVAGGLILASFLMWRLAEDYSPGIALFLICIVLANSEILFSCGNTAGIAVSFCLIAVWCFIKERFIPIGILCMAISLAIKPHDAGLIWLFFLLAGGLYRKRALQTLGVTAVLCLPALLWVSHVAPHWMMELHSNLQTASSHGSLNDPGPASIAFRNPNMIINLQSVLSVFRDDPRFYNAASYLICGALLLVWSVRTLRSRFSIGRDWFALASIATLSLLPVYHRGYDAKLLLLTVPACALLWAQGGTMRWIALLLNTAGVVLSGDIPSAILIIFANYLKVDATGILGRILTVVLMRPVPLVLLAMGFFYLWIYLRENGNDVKSVTDPSIAPCNN